MTSYVGLSALAAALQVHPRTVQRWHHDGAIRPAYVTAGGHARWDVEDVRRQLAERADAAARPDQL